MERDSKSIQEIIEKIVTLLEENDEQSWANYLQQFLLEYNDSKTRTQAVMNTMSIYKGGMGSFADLVLQRNLKMLVDENNQLSDLKHKLYNACLDYCVENQIKID